MKRRNWVVNPKLQYRLIALIGGFIILFTVVIHALSDFFYSRLLNMVDTLNPEGAKEIMEFIEGQRILFQSYSFAAFLFLTPIFAYFALKESNKIAGPIYNLTNRLKGWRENGTAEAVKFRTGDYFPELQNEYNLLITKMCPEPETKPKDNSEAGFSLVEILIVMSMMGMLGLGVMKMTQMIQKNQNNMNAGLATRDLIEDIHAIIGFNEVCKENFQAVPISATMSQSVSSINTLGGTPKYEVGKTYEDGSLEILAMQLENFQTITTNQGRLDLKILLKKKKMTGGVSEIQKKVPVYITTNTTDPTKLEACYAQGGGSTQKVCEEMKGTFNATTKNCILKQVIIDSASPQSLTASSFNLHLKDSGMGGEMGIAGSDMWFNGGYDSGTYFFSSGSDSKGGGFIWGRHTTTPAWPSRAPNMNDFMPYFSIANDGRVGVGYDTKVSHGGTLIPDDGGTFNNPTTRFFVRGNSKFTGELRYLTGTLGQGGFNLDGYLGSDATDNDIMIGSYNSNARVINLHNKGSNTTMDLLASRAKVSAACVGTDAQCGSLTQGNFTNTAAEQFKTWGNIAATGTVSSSGSVLKSDRRYKKNIAPLRDSLEKLLLLEGVSYDWRRGEFKNMTFEKGLQLGVIAQDVEEVVPELVHTSKDGYKSVKYQSFIPMLIEGFKTLYHKITNVEGRQLELEKKVALQEEEIKQLKMVVCLDHPEAEMCKK